MQHTDPHLRASTLAQQPAASTFKHFCLNIGMSVVGLVHQPRKISEHSEAPAELVAGDSSNLLHLDCSSEVPKKPVFLVAAERGLLLMPGTTPHGGKD